MRKIISGRNHLFFYLAVLFLINILIINYPLANVFGFEFSVINSVLLVFLSGFYTLALLSKEKDYSIFLKNNVVGFISFLIIPPLISIANNVLTVNCSISDGIVYYLFITFPSVIIGASIAFLSVFISDKFRYVLFIPIVLAILSITFFEFFYNPQIYFYNPVYAYFPGTIYDEAVPVDLKLMVYRILNLLFFGVIYFISAGVFYKISIFTRKFVIYISLVIAALFIYFSPEFGFSTTQNKLKSVLNKKISTEHFEIYFSPDADSETVKIISLEHEYYFQALKSFYNVEPEKKYVSFIFKDDNQKKKYFGSENADVAKPWLKETFTIADNYNSSLRHEIAHCFAGEFGWGLFRVADNFNPALIEGTAVAGAPEYDLNSIHYMAALAYNNGYKIQLENLFSGLNFFGNTSGLSYIYAGSFCIYLVDKYGIEKFKRLYSDINFKRIYGKSVQES